MSEANVELARRGWEAALRGDVEFIGELLDPEVKWHGGDPGAPGACHNRRQAMRFINRARGRRRVGELVEVLDAGEQVVLVMRPGTPAGEDAPLVANLTTFRDGKVIEMVHYPDPADARAAAGL